MPPARSLAAHRHPCQDSGAPLAPASSCGCCLTCARDGAHGLIDRGEVIAALSIPVDFSRRVAAGETGRARLLVDGRRSNSGQITTAYLTTIAADMGAEVLPDARTATPVVVRHWFNPNLIYRWFIVPGLTGILALFSALLITSLSIARERELGTFDQLLVSPTSTPEIIVSKSLPALIIGTALGLLMVGAGVFLFGIPSTGSFLLLLVSLVLFIASVVGIGLMISAVSQTQQQAILGAFAIGVPAVRRRWRTCRLCCSGWRRPSRSRTSSSSSRAAS